MARQINTRIIGTFNGVIYYKWRNDYYLRIKGNTGRQAPVAKTQSHILGQAAAVSARLRACFSTMLSKPTNRGLMYRLNNALQQWLRTGGSASAMPVNDIASLNGFSFRKGISPLTIKLGRRQDGGLSLYLPAFDSPNPISPLPFKGRIQLSVIIASCSLTNRSEVNMFETSLDISYNGIPIPEQELQLPLPAKPGCITVAAVSINKQAAGIVGALYN
ncbi:MAG TPA: hypothetical protein VK498_11535 [Ferruginibacter sp.]|nr:hypothetical protein [Ferruginibacter sp.]